VGGLEEREEVRLRERPERVEALVAPPAEDGVEEGR
jgi:hypothetical protein